jgi:hypothetical protein
MMLHLYIPELTKLQEALTDAQQLPQHPTTTSLQAHAKGTKRTYISHQRRTVVFLQQNYADYTLKELEHVLGIPWRKIQRLCSRQGIRKRQPNKKGHIPALALAA